VFYAFSLFFHLDLYASMPTPRRPLEVVDPNTRQSKELSPHKRGQIEGARLLGGSWRRIATILETPVRTVRTTVTLSATRFHGKSQPRSGRPIIYNDRDERSILRVVRQKPKITYAKLSQETGLKFSRDTYRRILAKYGIANWIAMKRPLLTTENASNRQRWYTERKEWDTEWSDVIFSDECSFERGSGKRPTWVFRTPNQKWHKDFIVPHIKGRDISIMIWAAIWIGGKSDLVVMERDQDAPRKGYSARSYLAVLDDQIPRCWQPGRIFMQDNASIHTAGVIKEWFDTHGISRLEWPPFSPDLNPIENVWAILKARVLDKWPHLLGSGASQEAYEVLAIALRHEWDNLEQEIIDNCIRSMKSRVESVRNAAGWYTKF
jgi:transposase